VNPLLHSNILTASFFFFLQHVALIFLAWKVWGSTITADEAERVRSQWPRGVRGVSAGARFLGLKVRFPPKAWMSVYVVQVEVSVTG
jgi:hypothetical protein